MVLAISNIDYTSRDHETIKDSLKNYVRATEPELWTDFFESNLGVVLMDFVAYTGDIVSFVADRISEEVFPATAQRRRSLIKASRFVGYSPQGSSPASVTVQVVNSSIPSKFSTQGLLFYEGTAFSIGSVTFELIRDYYFTSNSDPVEMDFSSGSSDYETFTSDGRQWQEYTIEIEDVINDSWTIYVDGVEWQSVENLLFYDAERIYEVVYEDKGYITVRFGNGIHGLIPVTGATIEIDYRYGGGIGGNIEAHAVDTNITGYFDDATTASVSIVNENRASGGEDEESIQHIKQWLPAWVKTNSRAVSSADYLALMNTFTDPLYGSPFRVNARLRMSGFGNILGGIERESRHMPQVQNVEHEYFGVGDGTTTSFSYTTDRKPIVPYTVRIQGQVTYGSPPSPTSFEVRDDGWGGLVSDYILGGSVDYDNGIIQVSFRSGNEPVNGLTMDLYYEFSPLTQTGVNRYDYSDLLGVGDGAILNFSGTITNPTSLLAPNYDAFSLSAVNNFGVRLKTTLTHSVTGEDVLIDLFDGSINTAGLIPIGAFTDLAGAPVVGLTSSINYKTGAISVGFPHPVKNNAGVYIYFTGLVLDWDEGDGLQTLFSGYVGEEIVEGTLRLHCIVGGNDIYIRDQKILGVWSLAVINTVATGVTIVSSSIDYDAGYFTFTISTAPDNTTLIKVAYQAVADATDLPYGVLYFVRGVEEVFIGGLENAGMYQWLTDRWYLLMDDTTDNYYLPANVVDIWLWSQDTDGFLSFSADGLNDAVRDWLLDNSIATVQLCVQSGTLQPFEVDLGIVYYDKTYNINTIRDDIREALRLLTVSDSRYPGDTVTMTEIYNAVYAVDGIFGFRMSKPNANITLTKNEMATFGKVERADTGIDGDARQQIVGYGDAITTLFSSILTGVSASNLINEIENSVVVETYVAGPTGIEYSKATSKVGGVPGTMEFDDDVGGYLDTNPANSYVNVTTGAIQLTYLTAPDTDVEIVVTYYTEHFVITGRLIYSPVIGGTVRFEFGDALIVDDGSGNLSASNITGTIDYETGDFQIDYENTTIIPPPYDGEDLLATYQYNFEATFVPLVRGEVTDRMGYCPDWDCPA